MSIKASESAPSREGQVSVTLINHSQDPKESIFCTWQRSRDRHFNMTTQQVKDACQQDPHFKKQVDSLFTTLLTDDLPLCEVVYFNFWLDNVPISLREQLVRHRVGMKPDATGKFGVDIVPELVDSTWWSQTMRVMDMGKFKDEGRFMIPDTIIKDEDALGTYLSCLHTIQWTYNELCKMGIPAEDARQVIPMGATHGMSWSMNLQAMKHVVGKRSCWIAQAGMWHGLIKGMIDELCDKVDPIFRLLATPPCIRGDKFVGCAFHEENIRRIDGRDHMHPPCSLYMNNHMDISEKAATHPNAHPSFAWTPEYDEAEGAVVGFNAPSDKAEADYKEREKVFGEFWKRDTETGKLLQV
jgi:thymidylate synthase ThyX